VGRTLKYDIPGRDFRVSEDEIRARGWDRIFAELPGAASRLVVEIGFGRGEFLRKMAAADPKTAFVGVELSFKRVLKMTRRIAASEIENLRLLQARGENVVHDLLEAGSVAEFWINFPDPWPKKRHAKHRLVQPEFVHRLAECLAAQGIVYLATDDPAYAEQMDEVLSAEPLLENVYAPAHWLPEVPGRMHTAYEDEWRAQGRPLHFFANRRR
jgi:tRNA (guanine-N7-)-methyltransferase